MNIDKEERKMKGIDLAVRIYTIITGIIIAGLICYIFETL